MTDRDRKSAWRARHLGWLLVLPILVALVLLFDGSSTEVTVGHQDRVWAVGIWAAVAGALAAIVVVARLEPPLQGQGPMAIPAIVLLGALCTGVVAGRVADSVWQLVDFQGGASREERAFPIARAYVVHSRGVGYEIKLDEPPAEFSLSRSDYRAAFGVADDVEPVGYCLFAQVERKGEAMRIILPSLRHIPQGHVRRCQAGS